MAESEPSLASAIESLGQGDFAEAESICNRLRATDPENAKVWHLSGIVYAQQHDLAEAAECFQHAIGIRGDVAIYHYNLGLAYQNLMDRDAALQAYRDAVTIQPDFLEAQNNLGNCLVDLGETTAAVDHFRSLGKQFPDESVVHYNLANVLQDAGEYNDSIEGFRRAIELDPDFASARENLGRALSDVTRYDEALEVWREWLEHDPHNAVARHMVASITGEGAPSRCDDDYVRDTFDENFAKSYEKQLQRIQYKVPELVAEAIQSIGIDGGDLEALDAGCGTGLCAGVLRPLARHLVGVDLSDDMLQEAKKRNGYDELYERELTQFLMSGAGPFDLIVSGDTLCYFGALNEVMTGFFRCLKPNGKLIFTVERLDPDDSSTESLEAQGESAAGRYRLQPNGRYRHAESFVRKTLDDAGLSVVRIETGTLRMERGRAVEGLIVTAER
ncbi:photosystem I assembly protein Ycf3 [Stieleria neptunia]|uniref:Photosystem I assembly protein Ycf3 n=1 Tax=Stieleria neptunia TaxID=2527979 RepID=A0A518HZD4_9BACT|nr:tetratricopeptide repeat protein [Stieleria neptunia]QDV46203.1 photosystem I assembly protein Ycf3 [Stieleria neptunia]